MRINGPLKGGHLEQFTTVSLPNGTEARIVYDSTTNTAKYYNGSSWVELDGVGGGSGGSAVPDTTAKTADYTVTSGDCEAGNIIFTNEGATGAITFTLPTAVADYRVGFLNVEGYSMFIESGASDVISQPDWLDLLSLFSISRGTFASLITTDATNWYVEFNSGNFLDGNARGIFSAGEEGGDVNTIEYIQITTLSNTTDFGNLLGGARGYPASCSSLTRGVIGGGTDGSHLNVMDYIEIGTASNSADFGDLTVARFILAAASNKTYGLFMGGNTAAGRTDVVDYITFVTLTTVTDFGNLTAAMLANCGCASPTTAFCFCGSPSAGNALRIDYHAIASTGNFADFGDTIANSYDSGALSSKTRGIWGGSSSAPANTIEYITMSTLGNCTDFGDLNAGRRGLAATSSSIRGIFAGGAGPINDIEYIEIATTGNTSAFGDLSAARDKLKGLSNGHGGLL